MSQTTTMRGLLSLSVAPVRHKIGAWLIRRAERHYLICADVERNRAREATINAAYYEKQALQARMRRI